MKWVLSMQAASPQVRIGTWHGDLRCCASAASGLPFPPAATGRQPFCTVVHSPPGRRAAAVPWRRLVRPGRVHMLSGWVEAAPRWSRRRTLHVPTLGLARQFPSLSSCAHPCLLAAPAPAARGGPLPRASPHGRANHIPARARHCRAGGVGSTELSNFLTRAGVRCNLLTDQDSFRHVNRCRDYAWGRRTRPPRGRRARARAQGPACIAAAADRGSGTNTSLSPLPPPVPPAAPRPAWVPSARAAYTSLATPWPLSHPTTGAVRRRPRSQRPSGPERSTRPGARPADGARVRPTAERCWLLWG